MRKLKWYQYMAIGIAILGLLLIILGALGGNGTSMAAGIMIDICSIQLFMSKDKKKKPSNITSKG